MNTTISFLYSWIKHKNDWLITSDIGSGSFFDTISSQSFIIEFIFCCFSDLRTINTINPKYLGVSELFEWIKSVIKQQFETLEVQPNQLLKMLKASLSLKPAGMGSVSTKKLIAFKSAAKFDNVMKDTNPFATSNFEQAEGNSVENLDGLGIETLKNIKTKTLKRELSLNFHQCKPSSLSDLIQINLLYQTLFTITCLQNLANFKETRSRHDLFFFARPYLSKEVFKIMNEILQWTDFESVQDIEILFDEEYLNVDANIQSDNKPSRQIRSKFSILAESVCGECNQLKQTAAETEEKLRASLEDKQNQSNKIKELEEQVAELMENHRILSEKADEFQNKYLKQLSINTKKLLQTKQEVKNKFKLMAKELDQSKAEADHFKKLNAQLSLKLTDAEYKEDQLKLDLQSQIASMKSQLCQQRSKNSTPKSTKLLFTNLSLKDTERKINFNNCPDLNFRRVTEVSLDKFDLDEENSEKSQHITLDEVLSSNSRMNAISHLQPRQLAVEKEAFCVLGLKKETVGGQTKFLIISLLMLSICYSLKQ